MTIVSSSKGKEVAGENSGGKRKRHNADKTGTNGSATKRRRNNGVLRFIEDAAYEVDEDEDTDDDSLFGEDFQEDGLTGLVKFGDKPGKDHYFPFGYEEGELSTEELESLVEERYKPSSSFLTYAESEYELADQKRSEYEHTWSDPGLALAIYKPGGLVADAISPSSEDPTLWKVKCMVGRERLSAFCLMQKYVDFQSSGTKLNIISAFAVERVRGFIFIEAERQFDIVKSCEGIMSVYSSCTAPVPKNEVSHLLSIQSKCNNVSVGSWVRVKNGKYKGDLAEVIAVNETRKKATIKLIPRIDLEAMARKFGGGIASKKSATPAPRLINSTELEEFGPLIQHIRDRDTGIFFDLLDGMKLKDGYLYKRVSMSMLISGGSMPSEEELLKFEPVKKVDSDCEGWLTELYGEQEEKRFGLKGEGSSTCTLEVHDLVLFNRKDFGVIIGTVEDDGFKILKEGSEGPVVVTIKQEHLKKGSFAKKFTTLDGCLKTISVNDNVKVKEGPLQGWQGIVKQIFRGTIFLYDEKELENSGYICCKSQLCEKLETGDDACNGKGDGSSSAMVRGSLLSSKSPLSPKKPLQTNKGNAANRESKGGNFSIGQSLRIKVGPMKGYRCRILSIHGSDITVKFDSHHEILTVNYEHLSQANGKSSAASLGESAEPVQRIGLLGTKYSSQGAATVSQGERCSAGTLSTQRKSWPALPSSGLSLQTKTYLSNTRNSVTDDANKAAGNRSRGESISGTKTAWNCSLTQPKNQTGGPSWSKQTHSNKRVQSAQRTVKNDSSGNNPFHGNKNGMGKYRDSTLPQNSWEMTETFVGGRGSGGARGRRGVRGGRNQLGRGRTSSINPSSWDGGEDKRLGEGAYGGRGGLNQKGGNFGGRGGLNQKGGNFGGRGQSSWRAHRGGGEYNRGGFQGRGKFERGGFGGQGHGTRNQNGEWSNKHNLAFDGGEKERSYRGGFFQGRGRLQRGGFGGHTRRDQSNASGMGQTNQGWVWNTGKEFGKGGASGTWNLSNAVEGAVDPWGKGKAATGSSGKGNGRSGKGFL